MQRIVLDLEWNGAYSKKAHGYFNEIIEIGATRLSADGHPLDGFEALIRPVVSRKLTGLVTELTGIEQDSLKDGISFAQAVGRLRRWMGEPQGLILTWSTTDLLVLLENCRYFLGKDTIPFMAQYMDAQAYCQRHMPDIPSGQQIGLSRACEQLGISAEGMDMHRAEDDSRMTARAVERLYDPTDFEAQVSAADAAFYRRLTYKTRVVSRADDPLVKPEYLHFVCPDCERALRGKGNWRFYGHMLSSELCCPACDKRYVARVQIKDKYEGVTVRRKLTEKKPAQEGEPSAPEQNIPKEETV